MMSKPDSNGVIKDENDSQRDDNDESSSTAWVPLSPASELRQRRHKKQQRRQEGPHQNGSGSSSSSINNNNNNKISVQKKKSNQQSRQIQNGDAKGGSVATKTAAATPPSEIFTLSGMVDSVNHSMMQYSSQQQKHQEGEQQEHGRNKSNNNSSDDNDNDLEDYIKPELCRRNPDGTTVPVTEEDKRATDLRCKLKSAADEVSVLSTIEERIEWALQRRLHGNDLFRQEKYHDAMDVYTTCLVACGVDDIVQYKSKNKNKNIDNDLDSSSNTSNNSGGGGERDSAASATTATGKTSTCLKILHRKRVEEEIKFPILQNLSSCAMKLNQYKKVEDFCTMAINELPYANIGQSASSKVYYKRGKSYMYRGLYEHAKNDYDMALQFVKENDDHDGDDENVHDNRERRTIQREIDKLLRLIHASEVNKKKVTKAMRSVFTASNEVKRNNEGGANQNELTTATIKLSGAAHGNNGAKSMVVSTNDDLIDASSGIYHDRTSGGRSYSTLVARPKLLNTNMNTIHQPDNVTKTIHRNIPPLQVGNGIEHFGLLGYPVYVVTSCFRWLLSGFSRATATKSADENNGKSKER